jgi:broad specificity phosphatase PhoE
MEIIFIRHAEKQEAEDPFLTKKGIKQAKYLAKRLKKVPFDEFYSSGLNRTKQTSAIISKKIKLKPKIEKSLNEFRSECIKSDKNKWTKQEKKQYAELISFLNKITQNKNEKKKTLIIAHGVTNRIILSHFFNLDMTKLMQFSQSETAINIISWNKKFNNWKLRLWNDNSHIPNKLRHTSYI